MSERIESDKNGVLGDHEETVSLISLLTILARRKMLVIGLPVLAGVAAVAASMLMTPIFTSTAVVMPPQQSQGSGAAAALLGQLGGLAGSGLGGVKSPNDLYAGMLKSRTIADGLITEFKLKDRYKVSTSDEARKRLELATSILNGKDGLISISVDDRDPQFAANLANAYVSKLQKLTGTLAIGEAARRRKFFELQVVGAKNELANAEVSLRKIQESTGMLELSGQVKGLIANSAQLQGEIAAKEVQLTAMRSYATKNNPEVLRLQEEIGAMSTQLSQLTKGNGKDGLMIATGKIPQVGVEYVRAVREVKYYEAMFEMLAKQYELAKVEEANNASVIQVLDDAVPAEKKSRPLRTPMVALSGLGGIIFGIIFALLRDLYVRSTRSPAGQERWAEFAQAWRGRKLQ